MKSKIRTDRMMTRMTSSCNVKLVKLLMLSARQLESRHMLA